MPFILLVTCYDTDKFSGMYQEQAKNVCICRGHSYFFCHSHEERERLEIVLLRDIR